MHIYIYIYVCMYVITKKLKVVSGPGKYLEGWKNEYKNKVENNARLVVQGVIFISNWSKSLLGFLTLKAPNKKNVKAWDLKAHVYIKALQQWNKRWVKVKPLNGDGLEWMNIINGIMGRL